MQRSGPSGLSGVWRVIAAFGWWGLLAWPAALWSLGALYVDEWRMVDQWRPGQVVREGRDFVNVWEGGRLVLQGRDDAIYDRPLYRANLERDAEVVGGYAFSYPPHILPLAAPFGLFSYRVALALWTLLGLLVFWHAARPWLDEVGLPGWAALILPAGFVNIWAGHFGFMIGALALYGWRHSADRPGSAGFAFALMTVKPHLGVLVPPILLARRRWAAAAWAAVGAGLLVLVSLLVVGTEPWITYFTSTLPYQAELAGTLNEKAAYVPMMPTVERAMRLVTGNDVLIVAAWVAAGAIAAGILIWAFWRGALVRELGLLSILAVFPILPYSFVYDMVSISLVVLVFAARWRGELRFWEMAVLAYVFIAAAVHTDLARLGISVTPVLLLVAEFIGARHMVRDARRRAGPA